MLAYDLRRTLCLSPPYGGLSLAAWERGEPQRDAGSPKGHCYFIVSFLNNSQKIYFINFNPTGNALK